MQLEDILSVMTPEIYQNLKQSLELGRWPTGEPLTDEQRAHSLQALIAWEHEHLSEMERTGYMPVSCKKTEAKTKVEETILRFRQQ